jgi:hypothetical protein
MTTLREAAQQALEALGHASWDEEWKELAASETARTLFQVLEAEQQIQALTQGQIDAANSLKAEPVAWVITFEKQNGERETCAAMGRYKDVKASCDFGDPVPLYTHPQPKQWVNLTGAEIDKIAEELPGGLDGFMKGWGWQQFARKVEDELHQKNT